jgi:hypothetical protein
MDELDDNNVINFNYTPKGSKNYEENGAYNKYKKPTRNPNVSLILSYTNDAPKIPSSLNPSFSKGHHELSHHIVRGEPIKLPTRVSNMTDYDIEYKERQTWKNRSLGHLGTIHECGGPKVYTHDEIMEINETVAFQRSELKRRGLTI